MIPPREQLLTKVFALPSPPVAIEALWDGDSGGWRVGLFAVVKTDKGFDRKHLGSFGGEAHQFSRASSRWPEAVAAEESASALATQLRVPFYFPSPNHPEDDCPTWEERERGSPCRRCGIPLIQRDPCPWRGVCYFCHLDEEREKREATWTPEARAGPRCFICGNPAQGLLNDKQMCPGCLDKYEEYPCSRCGGWTLLPKTSPHTDLCPGCVFQDRMNTVAREHVVAVREVRSTKGKIAAVKLARELLGMGLNDAVQAVEYFEQQ